MAVNASVSGTLPAPVLPARRRSRRLLLGVLVLSLLVLAVLLRFPPGWVALALSLGVAFVAATWIRPALGVASVLALTLLVEQFSFASFSPVTQLIPLFDVHVLTRTKGLEASPLEVLLLTLTAVVLLKVLARERVRWRHPLLVPMLPFLLILPLCLALGLAAGGSLSEAMWELRGFAYFSLLIFVVPAALRDLRDVHLVISFAIFMVCAKSAQGIWNYAVILKGNPDVARSVTSHEDALFIAWMIVLLAAFLIYRTGGRQRWSLLLALPILGVAFVATDRRAAYVALGLGVILLGVLFATDPAKRRLMVKIAIPAAVLLILITGAGWNSTSSLGAPADVVRSIVSPQSAQDIASDYYRKAEEVNLVHAIEANPVLGLGFGRPFQTANEGGIVTINFSLANYISHDEILWVWAKTGTFGFALFWVMIGGIIVFGAITFRRAVRPYVKALAAFITCAVAMQIVVSYVDLQLTYARNMVFLGILVGILARLPALDREETPDATV